MHSYVAGKSVKLCTNNPRFKGDLLPQLAAALPRAIALDTNDNQNISSLEGIGALVYLKTLRVTDASRLEDVSEEIGCLLNLEVLELSGNPELEDLPEEIGDLASLRVLIVDYCGMLSALPDSLTRLSGLQELHVQGCHHEMTLPARIGELRGLKVLNFGDYEGLRGQGQPEFAGLPNDVRRLVGLKELYMARCPLASLPDEFEELVGLEVLILDDTALQSIPCIGAMQVGVF